MYRLKFIIPTLCICALSTVFTQCKKTSNTTATVVNVDTSNNNIAITSIDSTSFILPNAFTPNGDGMNDTYFGIASNPGRISSYSLSIYESTGKLAFHTTTIATGWDGKVNGILDTNYRYEVHVSFTTVSGISYNGNTFLFLLPNSPSGILYIPWMTRCSMALLLLLLLLNKL